MSCDRTLAEAALAFGVPDPESEGARAGPREPKGGETAKGVARRKKHVLHVRMSKI